MVTILFIITIIVALSSCFAEFKTSIVARIDKLIEKWNDKKKKFK